MKKRDGMSDPSLWSSAPRQDDLDLRDVTAIAEQPCWLTPPEQTSTSIAAAIGAGCASLLMLAVLGIAGGLGVAWTASLLLAAVVALVLTVAGRCRRASRVAHPATTVRFGFQGSDQHGIRLRQHQGGPHGHGHDRLRQQQLQARGGGVPGHREAIP
jgi:hypothetical protein